MRKKKEKEIVTYKKHHYVIIVFLSIFSLIMMYPMGWTMMTAFKTYADIRLNRTKFFPREWSIDGFITAFEKAPIEKWFINSVFVTVVVTLAVIFTSTLIGYVFAKYEFKGKNFTYTVSEEEEEAAHHEAVFRSKTEMGIKDVIKIISTKGFKSC